MFTQQPDEIIIAVVLLAFLSVITMVLGVILAIYVGKSERSIAVGIGFSAGIMLLISLFELIPTAAQDAGMELTLVAMMSGMLVLAFLHWLIPHTHLVKEKGAFNKTMLRAAYLVAFGLILHDVPEGFAMANSYIASPSLGILVAIAIALHNLPEEFAMAAPIVTIKNKRFLYTAAILSGLAEPLGAVIGLAAVSFHPALNPFFMAFSAGAMIFVSVHELFPMARQYQKIRFFIVGAVMSAFVYALLAIFIPE